MRFGDYCFGDYWERGMYYGTSHWGPEMYILMTVGIIAVIALLIVVVLHIKKKNGKDLSEVEEALKLRYINGEITEEEYQKMKKTIR